MKSKSSQKGRPLSLRLRLKRKSAALPSEAKPYLWGLKKKKTGDSTMKKGEDRLEREVFLLQDISLFPSKAY